MRILTYVLGVAMFYVIFKLGNVIAEYRNQWAGALLHDPKSREGLSKFFYVSGRLFQSTAVVLGFLDFVAVLVLLSGALTDLAMGF